MSPLHFTGHAQNHRQSPESPSKMDAPPLSVGSNRRRTEQMWLKRKIVMYAMGIALPTPAGAAGLLSCDEAAG